MPKAMIVSVGGSLSPIIFSLNKQKPDYIIFFSSKDSERQIVEIIRRLNFEHKATDKIITPSPEIIGDSYRALKEKVISILERWKVRPNRVIVDYTGGTKSMSVSLVLATLDFCHKYSYIGGRERTKQGLGIVIDGKERAYYLKNPWDEYAVSVKEKISLLFAECHFDAALNYLEGLKEKVSKESKNYYLMWIDIVKGYSLWDKFKHKEAFSSLKKGFEKFKIYAYEKKEVKRLIKHIESNLEFLQDMRKEKILLDLIANAIRRAEIEKKYDDAVARLYRALEKFAQNELTNLGIKTSNVKENDIPERIREEFIRKYRDKDNKIKLPLFASYSLLKEKGDKIGDKFFDRYEEIKRVIDIRNNSILAHGDNPIKEKIFKELLELVLDFVGVNKKELPSFPQITL